MTDWTAIDDPVDRLHGFLSGFHATYYVYTGVACGLFEALTEPRTPARLASQLDLSAPYVRRFCEAGLRWGLLEVEPADGDAPPAFELAEGFDEPLADADAPAYMGELFELAATHRGADYEQYPACFRTGETRAATDRDASVTELIEGSTRGLQTLFVEKLLPESLPELSARLADGGRLLDVGCGTGHLVCRLCDRYPALEAVGIDLDADAIERARARAASDDVAARASFRRADAATVDGEFDAAVLFLSLHEIDASARERVFDRLSAVLSADGAIAVFDETYPARDDQFDRDPYAAAVETQWSELVRGSDVPTRTEQRALLADAGFEERNRTTFAAQFTVYEATRQ